MMKNIKGINSMKYIMKRQARVAVKVILAVAFIVLSENAAAQQSAPEPEAVHGVAAPAITQRVALKTAEQPAPLDGYPVAYRLDETPHFAIKTNLLYSMATTMNLAVELRLWRKATIDLSFSLNPWTYNKEENSKFKFFLSQPEFRLWPLEAFNGHFFGLHGHYAYYNVGSLPGSAFTETMNTYRFEGSLAGAGLSYGYHWMVTPRLSLEAEAGAGFMQLQYGKYPCQTCARLLTDETKNYWGLTRAGLNLIYLF
ncbi:MAG: DUF3575 domain-containing protein [Bacteroidales bacterium]|jgi:hypothetical protein|nr:DUF3575 domain-containing protein [Bacteroidales bacterium]